MRPTVADQVKSFLLPLTVLGIVPAGILWLSGFRLGWGFGLPWDAPLVLAGAVLLGTGLYFLSISIQLFINIGRGTLAPWTPTQHLVVVGPYRYVRNPMISGVVMALLGESVVFGSIGIFVWAVIFFIVNHTYFLLSEEPGLQKRFGDEYLLYKNNVPRWIPRLRPWMGEGK